MLKLNFVGVFLPLVPLVAIRASVWNKTVWVVEIAVSCPECEGRLRHIHLYNRARIPKNYGLGRLDRTEKDKYNGKIYNMLTSIIRIKANPEQSAVRHNGLVLMGAPGTGKTYLMAGFVYQCTINHGISCMFRPFDKLLSELKEGYATGKSEMETLPPYWKQIS